MFYYKHTFEFNFPLKVTKVFLYTQSIIVKERNWNRQVSHLKDQKSESAKKIAIIACLAEKALLFKHIASISLCSAIMQQAASPQ